MKKLWNWIKGLFKKKMATQEDIDELQQRLNMVKSLNKAVRKSKAKRIGSYTKNSKHYAG